ncbi:hypothetical protein ACNKHR_09680 [Shigella flexneri]
MGGRYQTCEYPLPAPGNIELTGLFAALSVMFWCFVGLEAFAHLASEFKNPERDFMRIDDWSAAGRISLLGLYGSRLTLRRLW